MEKQFIDLSSLSGVRHYWDKRARYFSPALQERFGRHITDSENKSPHQIAGIKAAQWLPDSYMRWRTGGGSPPNNDHSPTARQMSVTGQKAVLLPVEFGETIGSLFLRTYERGLCHEQKSR